MSILRRISPMGFMSRTAEDEAAPRSIQSLRHPPAARRHSCGQPVGRQSAEGGVRQGVAAGAAPAAARRADARRRCRRQGRDLPTPARAHRAGSRRARRLERAPRTHRTLRPDRRDAGGTQRRGISRRRRRTDAAGDAPPESSRRPHERRDETRRRSKPPTLLRTRRARSACAGRALPERHRPGARADRRRRVLADRGTDRSCFCRPTTSPTSSARSPRPASSRSA